MADTENQQQGAGAQTEELDASLLDQILQETKLAPSDDGYDVAKKGVAAFISELLKPTDGQSQVSGAAVDMMITEIDKKLSDQVDQIIHNEDFKTLESAWRSLKFVVDRTDFRQNIKIEMMSVSKDELLEDFEDSPEVVKSGLYKHIYTAEYGQFGGQPVGAVVTNYDFGPGSQDIKLAQYCASVGSMSHAPFIAAASPAMFGVDTFEEIPNLKDMESIFEGPKYAKWNSFRESEDSRYFALAMPRFMLRTPYGPETTPVKAFNYEEESGSKSENYLWGNAAFAMATKLTDSFAKFRWCPNIIGPQSGGAVEDLPVHTFEAMGQLQSKIPTEVLVSDRKEYELAEQGFISLTMRKGSDNAAFFSANSVQKPKFFGNNPEAKDAELNYKLGTQLPYMMIINRLAHYIKVLQRENIGSWKDRNELQSELNNWIRQYVSDQDNPSADVRSRRPLRKASITVSDVEGEPGWYSVSMAVQPHFKYMGADFTLSLKGKLDKA
ncbi:MULTISPECIES: type VI secretion system contractile sheath large subunit [Stappiaceae]|jgi:type VI secretion system protein ImpC|uniref:type VI secretion system contractile sheath large subunit n=1 Tax=Stappiaceae TaxID=2821832 RepID=UPI000925BA06|nr:MULTISPECIES: type VI secretion system contractile sheath large subunit [Stappiaceae]MBO9418550.1 type VI secretion system contractile sheath large subunit [Labrenzia sp. R4_2]MBO9424557.1 type VI secretion system contractile sheath large subunit [Labrenzia sp. R4_1]OJJ09292.1 type VI secretion protein [Alphaproteobacteria bacterium AO1-B]